MGNDDAFEKPYSKPKPGSNAPRHSDKSPHLELGSILPSEGNEDGAFDELCQTVERRQSMTESSVAFVISDAWGRNGRRGFVKPRRFLFGGIIKINLK